jgi:hypothetical protein
MDVYDITLRSIFLQHISNKYHDLQGIQNNPNPLPKAEISRTYQKTELIQIPQHDPQIAEISIPAKKGQYAIVDLTEQPKHSKIIRTYQKTELIQIPQHDPQIAEISIPAKKGQYTIVDLTEQPKRSKILVQHSDKIYRPKTSKIINPMTMKGVDPYTKEMLEKLDQELNPYPKYNKKRK